MKHTSYNLFLVLLVVSLTGCLREKFMPECIRTISSITAEVTEFPDTKAYLAEGNTVAWDVGDAIGIFSDMQGVEYYSNDISEDGSASTSFSGHPVSGSQFFAFYPGDGSVALDPANQNMLTYTYEPDSPALGMNPTLKIPMFAKMSENVFKFKQTMGMVHFSIQGEHVIKYLRLRGNNSEALAGHGTIDMTASNPVFVLDGTDVGTELLCQPDEPYSIQAGDKLDVYFPLPKMSFSDGFALDICYVEDGEEKVVTKYTDKTVTVSRASVKSFTVVDLDKLIEESVVTYIEPGAVDLGIFVSRKDGTKYKVLFAEFNLGATRPEEFGEYYAWGETEPKRKYDWKLYQWCNGADSTFTKYCANPDVGNDGFTDGKADLDPEDDAAHMHLGGDWRMPTREEMDALLATKKNADYSWEWKTINGNNGLEIVQLATGNSLFLPVAGYWLRSYFASDNTRYWVSSLDAENQSKAFFGDIAESYSGTFSYYRCYGLPIRPVRGGGDHVSPTGVSLDRTKLTLTIGESYPLVATITPANAQNKDVTWSSSNENVVTVSSTGVVEGVAMGRATITVTTVDGGIKSTCDVLVKYPSIILSYPEPEAVDIGLPVKWASFNLGATKPEEYGGYFSWGETDPKDVYNMDNYLWYDNEKKQYSRYCVDDGKGALVPADDAVQVHLGGKWRMPTLDDFRALLATVNKANYVWEWKTVGGYSGMEITYLVNGNSIFLPASGFMFGASVYQAGTYATCWSSTLDAATATWGRADALDIKEDAVGWHTDARDIGYPIRPVYDEGYTYVPVTGISLEETSLVLYDGQTSPLVASLSPANATNPYINWSSSNTAVAEVSRLGIVIATGLGQATITALSDDGEKIATCLVTVIEDPFASNKVPAVYKTPEAVDLGLSVKWASFNLGATKPEEYGCYFAWGETDPKDSYFTDSYKWINAESGKFTKYCLDTSEGQNGFADGKSALDPEDDAAYVKLGGKWRMPTKEESDELIETENNPEYRWEWISVDGHTGMRITYLRNGNSIFLPVGGWISGTLHPLGHGQFWTSTLSSASYAYCFSLSGPGTRDLEPYFWSSVIGLRYNGYSIRPVYAE